VVEENWKPDGGRGKVAASGAAILFCKEPAIHEVIVTGKKQGATEKHKSVHAASSSISKLSFNKDFKSLHSLLYKSSKKVCGLQLETYRYLKHLNKDYKHARESFFKSFSDWIAKPPEDEMFT